MIQIELRPELEAQIAAQAKVCGPALEQYIIEKLETTSAVSTRGEHTIDEAIERIHVLRQEDSTHRYVAVDAMGRFAAQHGFANEGENFKSLAHQGHKY